MFRTQPNARELSRHVAELPPEFSVSRLGDRWVVVGPTGIVVVGRAGNDLAIAAERTVEQAHQLRAQLGEAMPWVPFVDSILVAEIEMSGLACPVIDMDMLARAVSIGAPMLDDAALAQIRHHLPIAIAAMATPADRPLDPA